MREHDDFIASESIMPSQIGEMVSIFVNYSHPLLQLKRALDWRQIEAVMSVHWRAAGKNVSFGRGLSFPVSFYARLLVLMSVKGFDSRQMEQYMAESVVARLFVEVREPLWFQVRDHSSIARAQAGLGEKGYQEVNQLIVKEAVRFGFAKLETLSSDTTVQEPLIGYPHEAGILRAVAERVQRAAQKLANQGITGSEKVLGKVKEVLKKVKHYYLFAKGAEAKDGALREVVRMSQEMLTQSQELISKLGSKKDQVIVSALKKLNQLKEFGEELMPQIQHWFETGRVAAGKLLHCGITEARAIVKNKSGKKTEFGLKWLINRLSGGYVFGEVVGAQSSESGMPLLALASYRKIFGAEATPEMMVYDRGGDDLKTRLKLNEAGVGKVGIQPKGKRGWSIVEADQEEAMSQRGQTEGVIGSLKSQKYEFHEGRQRTNESLKAAGQWSILGLNLNNLVRDLNGK